MKLNNMKSRRIHHKSSKPSLKDPKIVDSGHTSATKSLIKQADGIRSVASKPFIGKVFYLDLPSNKRTETLENDITKLGGTIEKFFSKEIKYLVSNKKEARYVQYLSQDSPVPSPDSGHSSPHPHPGPCRHSSPHPHPGPCRHSSPHPHPGPCRHSSPHPHPGPCRHSSPHPHPGPCRHSSPHPHPGPCRHSSPHPHPGPCRHSSPHPHPGPCRHSSPHPHPGPCRHSSPHPHPGPCRHSSPHPHPGPCRHSSPHPHPGPCRHSSPHPHPGPCSIRGSSQGPNDTVVQSRGKSLVDRVVKEQERLQVNKTLSKALEWGVKILYIDDITAYVEKKKKNVSPQQTAAAACKKTTKPDTGRPGFPQYKAGRIKKPFLKMEDSSRHYRPIYLAMPNMPEFNLTSASPCSPFLLEDKEHGRTPREHRARGARTSASEERGRIRPRKNRKRGGYCECCVLKYDNIKTHLQGELHQTVAQSDQYLLVDRLVSTLPFSFLHIPPPSRRCSISSTLCAPGLCVKEEEGGVDASGGGSDQTLLWPSTAEPQAGAGPQAGPQSGAGPQPGPQSGAGPQPGPQSGAGPQAGPQSGAGPQAGPQSGAGPQAGPHPALSSTAGAVKETISVHPSSSEPLPPGGLEGESACMEKNRPVSCHCGADFKRGVSTGNLVVPSSQLYVFMSRLQEEEFPPALSVAEREAPPGRGERAVPQRRSSSPSPDRKLQRKVRDFKRKRRKVAAQASSPGCEEPEELSKSSSLLSIWQLFQSSEDMDWEFQGFPG
ncbi:protein DBF4 homolog A [Osmerus eperlanus]|uniref:protein DBF4 homolog A n=1 Tax=Osmerus eperlanus TaxID=29151 RepID=UPI002E1560F0